MRDNLDELRHIEGFPLGEEEDLHALSDPPHYTAYPNPHIAEFIQKYGKPYDEANDDYHREPFVSDISEGRSGPVYNAHSYHTKVPYEAIVPFIEHYTQPGEIVFDGFCGTGMTGVAAQSINRHAIINDLSPIATFIAYNYNTQIDLVAFRQQADSVLRKVRSDCDWMYKTIHADGKNGYIHYVIWSDVFECPYCGGEVIFWDSAVDVDRGKVNENYPCPTCKAAVTKRDLNRINEEFFDSALGIKIKQPKQIPVLINYSMGKKRYEKLPDKNDLLLIKVIQEKEIPYWYPTFVIPDGDKTSEPLRIGITHTHHFYTKRNLWTLSSLRHHISSIKSKVDRQLLFLVSSYDLAHSTKMSRLIFKSGGQKPVLTGYQSGTLYVPSLPVEKNVILGVEEKVKAVNKAFEITSPRAHTSYVTTQSTTNLQNIPSDCIDYIFVDPPFGDNLMYSELNFLSEAWIRAFTNNKSEAVMNNSQQKILTDYRELMTKAFSEMYRIIKPGRWITVEFHNSKASVWNAIQDALMRAGFVVAQVTVLDKQQGSFNQVTAAGAVKNDLVINAYKPQSGFTKRFISQTGSRLEADFIRQHLHQLPLAANAERSKEMLYSKYLAYYIQHGYQVAYNGEQFYRALPQWGLVERDGYWFADETQANEYEKRKVKTMPAGKKGASLDQQVLFISDEKSARLWLWGFLHQPRSYDEIYTAFVRALQTPEDQIPELRVMLEEGFVRANGEWKRPDTLTQAELEKRRLERLLRQFGEYLQTARLGQKLKEVRKEAVVAGFTEAYRESRFQDILTVGRRLDRRLLEESPEIFDFIDIAQTKEAA